MMEELTVCAPCGVIARIPAFFPDSRVGALVQVTGRKKNGMSSIRLLLSDNWESRNRPELPLLFWGHLHTIGYAAFADLIHLLPLRNHCPLIAQQAFI